MHIAGCTESPTTFSIAAVARFLRRWAPIGLYLLGSAFLAAKSSTTPHLFALSCVALIPLFLVVRWLAPTSAFWLGAYWGFCYALTLHGGGQDLLPGLWTMASYAGATGLFGFGVRWITAKTGCSPVVLAFGWALLSLALANLSINNRVMGAESGAPRLLIITAQFGGTVFLAFLVALANALLTCMIFAAGLALPKRSNILFSLHLTSKLHICDHFVAAPLFPYATFTRGPPSAAQGFPDICFRCKE